MTTDIRGVALLIVLLATAGACGGENVGLGGLEDAGSGGFVDETPAGAHEDCGNGMDDDGDGHIDEGCFCGPGETQACFNGTYPTRRVGACADGVQACAIEGSLEFGTWGPCIGDTLPGEELCDGIDNDCDGAVDEGCPCIAGETRFCGVEFVVEPCTGGAQTCAEDGTWSGCEGAVGPSAERCGDGIDNDCDGMVDEGCGCTPEPEVCDDGIDNDCDGMVDEPACTDSCPGGSTGIVDIDGSAWMFCARHRDGRVFCWGSNAFGGMGIGSETPETVPTAREIVDRVDQLAVGSDHATCVRRGDEINCWGRQPFASGRLGRYRGVEWSPFEPAPFTGLRGVEELRVGLDHYMVRLSDGTIHGWGYDTEGALGDGPTVAPADELRQALTIDDAVDLDAFVRTVCAVRSDGTVWCWGDGEEGQTGPPGGSGFKRHAPYQIAGVTDARSVEVGRSHVCALRATGEVVCWGMDGTRGDGAGFVGDAAFTTAAAPVPGVSDAVQLEVGDHSSCVIRTGGELWCWGAYSLWRAPEWVSPRKVEGLGEVLDVAMGGVVGEPSLGGIGGNMCVLERCGRVRCWGRNPYGQLGDGSTTDSLTPVDVTGLP